MQLCAQENLPLHLYNTIFFETVLGPGMVVHVHQLVLILFPGNKQTWKNIRDEFIAHCKSQIHITETILQHNKIISLTLNQNHNSNTTVELPQSCNSSPYVEEQEV